MRGSMRGSRRVLCHTRGKGERMQLSPAFLAEADEISALLLDYSWGREEVWLHTEINK